MEASNKQLKIVNTTTIITSKGKVMIIPSKLRRYQGIRTGMGERKKNTRKRDSGEGEKQVREGDNKRTEHTQEVISDFYCCTKLFTNFLIFFGYTLSLFNNGNNE